MAPPSAEVEIDSSPEYLQKPEIVSIKTPASSFPAPLKYSGSLDEFENFNVTSIIGREFPKLQLSRILEDDTKIRDLAITGKNVNLDFRLTYSSLIESVSQRGVIFFRKQDLSNKGLKTLAQKLGKLSGGPKEAGVGCLMN